MRASVFVGTSLDGYMARVGGTYDFLPADGGEPHGYEEFFASVDALVIGRNTYEVVLDINPWPYGDKPVFVAPDHHPRPGDHWQRNFTVRSHDARHSPQTHRYTTLCDGPGEK